MCAALLLAVAVPLFLLGTAVRSVALDKTFYLAEFARYGVGQTTGLSPDQLAEIADAFIAYFEAPPGQIDVRVRLPQEESPLLNDREVRHMADVQALMHGVFGARNLGLLALLVGALALVAASYASTRQLNPSARPRLRSPARTTFFSAALQAPSRPLLLALGLGGITAVVSVGLVALVALLDFSALFLQFHFLSFANDLWMLDPGRDRLIQLFPQGFFFDASMRVALQTAGSGALVAFGSLAGLRLLPRP
jgi:hypothetical protein